MDKDKLKRIIPLAVGLLLGVFMIILEGRDMHVVIVVSIIAVAVVAAIFAMEKFDSSRRTKFDESIYSGERYASEKWRAKQERFLRKNGFKAPQKSMRQDLLKHASYQGGILFIILGVLVVICFWAVSNIENDLTALIFGIIAGAISACYGYYRMHSPKLRKLISTLEQHPKFDVLNEAYMNGRTISYKCSGLNLGAGIVTLFTPKALVPITFNEIREIHYYIEHRLYETNSLYSGSENHYYVRLLAGDDKSVKEFPLELGERAAVEAVEQLAQAGLPVLAEALGIDTRMNLQ